MILYYIFFILGIPGNVLVLGMVKYKPLNPQDFLNETNFFWHSFFHFGKNDKNAFLLTNLSVSGLILLTTLPIKIALINNGDSFKKAETGFYSFFFCSFKNKFMRNSKVVPRALEVENGLCKFYLGCPVLCLMASLLTIAAGSSRDFLCCLQTKI